MRSSYCGLRSKSRELRSCPCGCLVELFQREGRPKCSGPNRVLTIFSQQRKKSKQGDQRPCKRPVLAPEVWLFVRCHPWWAFSFAVWPPRCTMQLFFCISASLTRGHVKSSKNRAQSVLHPHFSYKVCCRELRSSCCELRSSCCELSRESRSDLY